MIYYSHINEDNRIERKQLQRAAYRTVIAICGSGERVISLMDNRHCKKFHVVDFNDEAIYLLQLKLAALRRFSVDEYLQFIGHTMLKKQERRQLLETLTNALPPETLKFWQLNNKAISKGILHSGQFEIFLSRVRPLTNCFLGKNFQQVFTKNIKQVDFPVKRWAVLKKLFSYKIIYRLAGNKDVAFVGKNANLELIPAALEEAFKSNKASTSFMANLVFKGDLLQMQETELPPSLDKEVLKSIKQRLVNNEISIGYHPADFLQFIKSNFKSIEPPVFYSLSDLLSFVDFQYVTDLLDFMAREGDQVIGRSFLRNRLTTSQLAKLSKYGEVALHDEQESTGMYQVFSIKFSAGL